MNIHKIVFLKDVLYPDEMNYVYELFYALDYGAMSRDILVERKQFLDDLISYQEDSDEDGNDDNKLKVIIEKCENIPDDVEYITYYAY